MDKKIFKINEILSICSENKQSYSFYATIIDSTYPLSNKKRCQSVIKIFDETTNSRSYEFIVSDNIKYLPIISKVGDLIKVVNSITVISMLD